MAPLQISYKCFLISAFGRKTLLRNPDETVDFDEIQHEIKEAVQLYERDHPTSHLTIKRSDDYAGGVITQEFFLELYNAHLVIAEVSCPSLNVYYELGIRHALKRRATILLAIEGTPLPFDIKDMRVIFYQPGTLIKDKLEELHRLVEARLEEDVVDSPVFAALPDLESLRKAEVDELRRQILTMQNITHGETYGIKITSPQEGDEVKEWTTVRGYYTILPPIDSIRLFNVSPSHHGYWPQTPPVQFDTIHKAWIGRFHLGGKPPEEGTIVVAVVGKATSILCNYFEWAGQQVRHWPAIQEFPDDFLECDRIRVVKTRKWFRLR